MDRLCSAWKRSGLLDSGRSAVAACFGCVLRGDLEACSTGHSELKFRFSDEMCAAFATRHLTRMLVLVNLVAL